MSASTLSIAITGAGGAGVISVGELLLKAWASHGGRGLLRKAFGPQIRGGEAAALLKLTDNENYTAASEYKLLVALDWMNFARFEDEIQLAPDAVVICETLAGAPDLPESVTRIEIPLSDLAADSHSEGRTNMVVAGLLGQALGLETSTLCKLAADRLSSKASAYRDGAIACVETGAGLDLEIALQTPASGDGKNWCLSGNQAAAFGALAAGIRFVAAYPITPASDLLEWMATPLEQLGGELLQAEDELAAINMAIGAAFGGVPSFTATSGPGLALMSESIGLAVAAEVPVTIINVQRGGPSTGIPTKSEQSDLNIALYGLHGDAPHPVLAPLDTADCVFTAGWAVNIAQDLQTPVVVLSDQMLGQSTAVVSEPRRAPTRSATIQSAPDADFLRYRLSESGVSALSLPGDPDRRYTADGLEHNEKGTPSARDSDHRAQLDKRSRKLLAYDYEQHWARLAGDGELALVSFGSVAAVANEAATLLAELGIPCRTLALRLLAPLQVDAVQSALEGCRNVVVIEQNHSAQLLHYLRGCMDFDAKLHSFARPGPVPLNPQAIATFAREIAA